MSSTNAQPAVPPDRRYLAFTGEPRAVAVDAELDCLVDVFRTTDGNRHFVVLTDSGEPHLLSEAAALESARIRQQLAVHDMVADVAPRRLAVSGLYLFLPVTASEAVDLKGPNDPVAMRGCLSGPWLTEQPAQVGNARVMVMRADLLSALAGGFVDQFVTPTEAAGGARAWSNLWLPVADEETIAAGRGCVLAYPHNPLSSFLETGNHDATCNLAEQLLGEFRDDLRSDGLPGRLRDATLPVACLQSHREKLAANGISVRDGKRVLALPDNAGWLRRLYHAVAPQMEALPEEGDVAVFSSFAAMAVADLGDWPGPRSVALWQRLQRFQALWTPQIECGMRPVRYKRDGQFEIDAGALRTSAGINPNTRRLYFAVDPAFATAISDRVELEFDYLDDDGPPIVVSFNSPDDAYAKASPVPRQGSGEWLTKSLPLAGAAFSKGQNAGADFRLEFGHSEGAVRRLLLKAK